MDLSFKAHDVHLRLRVIARGPFYCALLFPGIPVQTRLPEVKQLHSSTVPTGTYGPNTLQAGGLHKQRHHQQNRQPQPQPQPGPQLQPQQESTQFVQQQNKQEQEAQQHTPRQHHQQLQPGPRAQQQQIKARARRVAASAARRALLLEQLANARVQARSRIVRLPLRLSIAGRAKSRRYLTLPVDVEGALWACADGHSLPVTAG